ncbi:MAG: site-2 protease family protein, partial [Halobacteria archaeon]|nr:site-2 protease family protein [Halobacteria archaeon]
LGHSWVALRYGIEIESITLWILGGIAGLKSIPRDWHKEFWIAIAGPATSIGVGIVCYVALVLVPSNFPVVVFVVGWLAVMNIVLAVFNLVPAFPMDGGRILRALLARSQPHAKATQTAARVGVVFAFVFGFVGILNFNIILILLAFFIYGAAKTESGVTLLGDYLEGLTVRDVMSGGELAVVETDMPLSEFAQRMLLDKKTAYAVEEDGEIVGILTLDDVKKVKSDEMETRTVGDIAIRDSARVSIGDDAFETLMAMGQNQGRNRSALVEENGKVVGVVTQNDFGSILELRKSIRVPQ